MKTFTDTYYSSEYYDTNGGHGDIGSFPDFKTARKKAIKLYKHIKKDKELGTCTTYIGVSGSGDRFCIVYIEQSYLANINPDHFNNQIAYDNWMTAAKKALKTGPVINGKYSKSLNSNKF